MEAHHPLPITLEALGVDTTAIAKPPHIIAVLAHVPRTRRNREEISSRRRMFDGSFGHGDLLPEERDRLETPEHRDMLGFTFPTKTTIIRHARPAVIARQEKAQVVV